MKPVGAPVGRDELKHSNVVHDVAKIEGSVGRPVGKALAGTLQDGVSQNLASAMTSGHDAAVERQANQSP